MPAARISRPRHTLETIATINEVDRMAQDVMRSGHAKALVICPAWAAADLRGKVANLCNKARGVIPPILDLTSLPNEAMAFRMLQTSPAGYVLSDKSIPTPRGTRVINVGGKPSIPNRSYTPTAKRHGLSGRRSMTTRRARAPLANLSHVDDRVLQGMSSSKFLKLLISRDLTSTSQGKGSSRHRTDEELLFRGQLVIRWASQNKRPHLPDPLMSGVIYPHLYQKKLRALDPQFAKRLYKAAPHWAK